MRHAPLFLDYHATAPLLTSAADAMQSYWHRSLSVHETAAVLEDAQQNLCALIGAAPRSLTFTSGATEANNLALTGAAIAATDSARRDILISAIEHDSILQQTAVLQKNGFTVRRIPVSAEGMVDPAVVRDMVSDKTLLVSVMWANHEIGTVQPVADIAQVAKAAGALVHADATQAVGKLSLNVNATGIDLLSFSAHKMGGPQGIGALYVRQTPPVAVARILHGGAQQAYRPGTIPLPLVAGFAAAAAYTHDNMTQMNAHRAECAVAFLSVFAARNIGYAINGGVGKRLAGSLNLRFAKITADDLLLHVANDMIFSSGAACRNGAPSQVLAAIGLSPEEISRSIRLCFGHGNTLAEVKSAAAKIADFIQGKA